MRTLIPLLLAALATPVAVETPAERQPVDLLLTDTLILTQDPGRATAEALAVAEGRIVGVGSSAEIRSRFDGPEHSLPGTTVLPGFHDAHSHPLSGGEQLLGCNLGGILDRDELLDAIQSCLERDPGDGWLLGRGWELSIFPAGNAPASAPTRRTRPTASSSATAPEHRAAPCARALRTCWTPTCPKRIEASASRR